MARGTTLAQMLIQLRAAARISQNAAHNLAGRDSQVASLQNEQLRLWDDFDWPHMREPFNIDLVAGQRFYAVPDNLDVGRIEKAEIVVDGSYVPLDVGITGRHYSIHNSDLDARSWPIQAWQIATDPNDGDPAIEVWPVPQDDFAADTLEGRLVLTGIRNLRAFVSDSDVADLDDQMIVGFVAAEYLAAAGAKDAQIKLDKANRRYNRLRGGLIPRRRYQMFTRTAQVCRPRRPVAIYRTP